MPAPNVVGVENIVFGIEQEARDYINKPKEAVVGDFWVIVKIPSVGRKYEFIDCIRI